MKTIEFKKLIAAKALHALRLAAAVSVGPRPALVPVRAKITPRFRSIYPK